MKRIIGILLSIILTVNVFTVTSFAQVTWPLPPADVESEGAILVDANSGAVIFGKNIHEQYYPASITKILTALLVIENCDLDEQVTFSSRAVYDVESGSSSAGYDVGDVVTVRTALYAMLLQSANEAANALAEHVAGSIEGFCAMMNQRAKKLGCKDSHFANPSGLNDPEHYTTAYDYSLICQEAFKNPTFVQIDGSSYYTLPASRHNPEPFTVYAHHNMLKHNNKMYYEGIIGGKTGYTSLAGNTLVTCAERDGLKLITVILNGHQTHYSDTKMLLDFGFDQFQSVNLSKEDTVYTDIFDDLDINGKGVEGRDALYLDPEGCVTLPKGVDVSEVDTEISYEVDDDFPQGAVARITCSLNERFLGQTYLERDYEREYTNVAITDPIEEDIIDESEALIDKVLNGSIWIKMIAIAIGVLLIALIILLVYELTWGKRRHREGFAELAKGRSRKKNKR